MANRTCTEALYYFEILLPVLYTWLYMQNLVVVLTPKSKVRHHLWKTLDKFIFCVVLILSGWIISLLHCLSCIQKPNWNRVKLSLAAATLLKLDIEFIEIHYRIKKMLSAQFANVIAKLMVILLLSINNQKYNYQNTFILYTLHKLHTTINSEKILNLIVN